MLRKMGLGFIFHFFFGGGGVQVSNINVKYYRINEKLMRGNVPHFNYEFNILLLDTHGGTFPHPYVTVVVYIVKLNVGRCLTLNFSHTCSQFVNY